jgi:hypothetical protein
VLGVPRRGDRRTGHRQVLGDRYQLGVGLRGVHRGQPLVQLAEAEPALGRGVPEDVGDPLAIGVRRA